MLAYIRVEMIPLTLARPRLDGIAMGLSGLCVVHCVATAIVIGLLASAGGLLGSPAIHEVGLAIAMVFASIALGRGILEHGFMMPSAMGGLGLGVMAGSLTLPHSGSEIAYSIAGVMILALGHRLNLIASE